jgi:hypothetical protein
MLPRGPPWLSVYCSTVLIDGLAGDRWLRRARRARRVRRVDMAATVVDRTCVYLSTHPCPVWVVSTDGDDWMDDKEGFQH